jgi:hypothetical protein
MVKMRAARDLPEEGMQEYGGSRSGSGISSLAFGELTAGD